MAWLWKIVSKRQHSETLKFQFWQCCNYLSKIIFQKVAKFFGAKKSVQCVVVAARSEISAIDFVSVQTFVAIEVRKQFLF